MFALRQRHAHVDEQVLHFGAPRVVVGVHSNGHILGIQHRLVQRPVPQHRQPHVIDWPAKATCV